MPGFVDCYCLVAILESLSLMLLCIMLANNSDMDDDSVGKLEKRGDGVQGIYSPGYHFLVLKDTPWCF